jgi:hypothetical protein
MMLAAGAGTAFTRTISTGTRSAAIAIARAGRTVGAWAAAVVVASRRRPAAPFGTRPARTAIVARPWRTALRFALVIGIAIGRWGFFYPVGQEFKIEFQWRIAHVPVT